MYFETVPGLITINATLPLQILHFIILMFILDRILFKPTLKMMDDRKLFINQKSQELTKLREEIEELKSKFLKMEEEAKRKASYERALIREEGIKEAEKILQESRNQALLIKQEAEKRIEEELKKVKPLLAEQAKSVAEEIMEKIVGSKVTGIILLLVSCLFFFASDGFSAAEAPSKARIIWNNIMLFVNFGIIVFLFLKYAKKPLLDFIFKEREKIKERLDELEREYENARFILNEQSKKLSNIEVYVQEIRRNILELARREREKIIEEARRNADRMLEEAKSYNEIEAKRAKQRLQEELIIMAISFVKDRLRRKMTNEMNEKVIAEFIKDMEKSVKN